MVEEVREEEDKPSSASQVLQSHLASVLQFRDIYGHHHHSHPHLWTHSAPVLQFLHNVKQENDDDVRKCP